MALGEVAAPEDDVVLWVCTEYLGGVVADAAVCAWREVVRCVGKVEGGGWGMDMDIEGEKERGGFNEPVMRVIILSDTISGFLCAIILLPRGFNFFCFDISLLPSPCGDLWGVYRRSTLTSSLGSGGNIYYLRHGPEPLCSQQESMHGVRFVRSVVQMIPVVGVHESE